MNRIFSERLNNTAVVGMMCALLAALGFSAKAVLAKLSYAAGAEPLTVMALRALFSVPFFIAPLFFLRRGTGAVMLPRDRVAVVALGLLGYYLTGLLDFYGLQYISAGLERLILFLYPTVVVLLTAMMGRTPVRRPVALGLALSYVGVALAFAHDVHIGGEHVGLGAVLVLGSTFAYAVYLVAAGGTIKRLGSARFTSYTMLISATAVLIHYFALSPGSLLNRPPEVYAWTAGMAVFSTVVPAYLLAMAIGRIGAARVAIIGMLGPLATMVFAYRFLGEPVSAAQGIGALLVLSGVLAVTLGKSRDHS